MGGGSEQDDGGLEDTNNDRNQGLTAAEMPRSPHPGRAAAGHSESSAHHEGTAQGLGLKSGSERWAPPKLPEWSPELKASKSLEEGGHGLPDAAGILLGWRGQGRKKSKAHTRPLGFGS